MFPIMLQAADCLQQQYPDLVFALLVAPTLTKQDFAPYIKNSDAHVKLHYISSDHFDIIRSCHSVMATSGTATLEVALLQKPMVIAYKTSPLNYLLAKTFLRIKYIGLCNILAKKMIVPEMIQHDLTPKNLFHAMQRFIEDPSYYQLVERELTKVKALLTADNNESVLADLIVDMIKN
jgi:lipid-A-disaccharide synthase